MKIISYRRKWNQISLSPSLINLFLSDNGVYLAETQKASMVINQMQQRNQRVDYSFTFMA